MRKIGVEKYKHTKGMAKFSLYYRLSTAKNKQEGE